MPNISVAAQLSDAYVSTWDVDIHKPDKRNTLFRTKGNQGMGFFQLLETLGASTPSGQTEISHFEEGWMHETLVSGTSVAASAAGASIAITIAASTIDTAGKYYVRPTDLVMFPNQTVGYVTQIVAGVATIVPLKATAVLGPVAAGQELIIYSNAQAERSGGVEGRISKPEEKFFTHQIIRESFDVTGTEKTNRTWLDKDSDGNDISAWHLKGQLEMDYRFALSIDGAALFGQNVDNPSLGALRTMIGLVPWIQAGGNIALYNPGLLTIADFDAMTRRLDKNFAPAESLGMLGIDLFQDIENLFTDNFVENPQIYANGSNRAQTIDIDIRQLKKTGRTYNFKKMEVFNHEKLYGAAGFDISGLGVWIPQGTTKDSKTKEVIPYVGMRYKQLGKTSRRMRVWSTGGAKETNQTSDIDEEKMHMLTEMATQFVANGSFYLMKQV